jgi:hypothetical protein
MFVHDEFHDREAHARALVFLWAVEPLEEPEDLVVVRRVEADPVILNPQDAFVFHPGAADGDGRR